MLTSKELQRRKKTIVKLIQLKGQERIEKKDLILIGYVQPEHELVFYQGNLMYKKRILINDSYYEFDILIPNELMVDLPDDEEFYAELLCENNFHTENNQMVYDIIVKYIHRDEPNNNCSVSNLSYINGHISYLHEYNGKVDFLVEVSRRRNSLSKHAYIPCVFYNYEQLNFSVGRHIKLWGELIEREFLREDQLVKILEVKAENVLILD